jgi:hypothetical protein
MSPHAAWEEIRLLGALLTEHHDEDCSWAVVAERDEDE